MVYFALNVQKLADGHFFSLNYLKTSELYRRIVAHRGISKQLQKLQTKKLQKMFQRYHTHLSKCNKIFDEIWNSLVANNSLNF